MKKTRLIIFKGDNGNKKYGVCDGDKRGAILYEPSFSKSTAQRVADLNNSKKPPKDWEATEVILRREGFKFNNEVSSGRFSRLLD